MEVGGLRVVPPCPEDARGMPLEVLGRGNNGNARRSFAFAQAFAPRTDSAQPCRPSERQRTDANGRPESTSWGSLVRAQYAHKKSLHIGDWVVRVDDRPVVRGTDLRR